MKKKTKVSLLIGLGIIVIFLTSLFIFKTFGPQSDSNAKDRSLLKINTKSASELEEELNKQPVKIVNSAYVVKDERLKSLYPDAITADLKNNSDKDIKNIMMGYVAWDKNGLPVKVKGHLDFHPAYLRKVLVQDGNMAAKSTDIYTTGYELDNETSIAIFKPIVLEYEDFDGKTWKNPEIDNFKKIYENKKLSDIKGYKN